MTQPLVFLLLILLVTIVNSQIILPPQSSEPFSSKPNKLLLLVQGAKVPANSYVSLAKQIQNQTSSYLNLWVAIPSFPLDIPEPPLMELNFKKSIQMVQQMGALIHTNKDVYIAGHSLGGVVATPFASDKQVAGFILLGSYLHRNASAYNLFQYNIPVLTVSAELDGLTRITRIAVEFNSMMQILQERNRDYTYLNKPVVTIYDINHSLFTNITIKGDIIVKNVKPETAHAAIGQVIGPFLLANEKIQVDEYLNLMDQYVQKTKLILSPFLKAREQDYEKENLCAQSQKQLLGKCYQPTFLISNELFASYPSFVSSKPAVTVQSVEKLEALIETKSFPLYIPNPIDLSLIQESPVELQCKMKSTEAVAKEMKVSCQNYAVNCSDVNILVFQTALSQVAARSKQYFEQLAYSIEFAADKQASSGITFLSSLLHFQRINDTTIVQSTALQTNLDAPFGFGGMHYCKLLSLSTAMEIILHDNFPKY